MIQQYHSWAYIQERGKLIQKDTWTPLFIAALLIIAKTLKQPKCPSTGVCVCMYVCVCVCVYKK